MTEHLYTDYTVEKLLNDEFFVKSIKHPTKESVIYWNEQVEKGIVSKKEFELAKSFLISLMVKNKTMMQEELDSLWINIENSNKLSIKKRFRIFSFAVSAAASIAIILTLAVTYYYYSKKPVEPSIASIASALKPQGNSTDVQLILGNNKNIDITDQDADIQYGTTGQIKVNTQTINRNNSATAAGSALSEYNQLIVPLGKRSTLTFSDGTKLWVNAGTRVVYPVTFEKNKREIYVDGEIYLNVEPDKKRPFVVKTKKMNIQVLGTSFNVMAYEQDSEQSVVLVTGSVHVKTDAKKEAVLVPNNRLTYESGAVNVKSVDVSLYVSWKDGLYIYNGEKLGNILDRLARYYGKEVIYDSNVSSLRCSGKLDLKEDIEDVLNGLSQTAPISFTEKGNRIEFCLTAKKDLPM